MLPPKLSWSHKRSIQELQPQGLITLSPTGTKCRVPVELTNTTPNRVVLPPKATLAKVQLASEIVIPRDPQQSDTTLRHGFDLEAPPPYKRPKVESKQNAESNVLRLRER